MARGGAPRPRRGHHRARGNRDPRRGGDEKQPRGRPISGSWTPRAPPSCSSGFFLPNLKSATAEPSRGRRVGTGAPRPRRVWRKREVSCRPVGLGSGVPKSPSSLPQPGDWKTAWVVFLFHLPSRRVGKAISGLGAFCATCQERPSRRLWSWMPTPFPFQKTAEEAGASGMQAIFPNLLSLLAPLQPHTKRKPQGHRDPTRCAVHHPGVRMNSFCCIKTCSSATVWKDAQTVPR